MASYTFPLAQLNDTELIACIYDGHNFPFSVINERQYDPFSESEHSNSLDNFLIQNTPKELQCDYYFCSESRVNYIHNNLSIMSYNISCVPLHLNSFNTDCLDSIDFSVDVIGLCKTRLHDNISSLYKLDTYQAFYQNKNTTGGGLGVFLKHKFLR